MNDLAKHFLNIKDKDVTMLTTEEAPQGVSTPVSNAQPNNEEPRGRWMKRDIKPLALYGFEVSGGAEGLYTLYRHFKGRT